MQTEPLTVKSLLEPLFSINSFMLGSERHGFILQLRGIPLENDSILFYEKVAKILNPFQYSAVFETDKENFTLTIIPTPTRRSKMKPSVNLALFLITLVSVLFTGGVMNTQQALPSDLFSAIREIIANGWPFALSLLAILGAHEFGHYFMGRARGIDVTLPFFIPMPLSMLGTMGAFINIRSLPKNKRALFDMAVAGPLSGLIISIIVLIIGLQLSSVSTLPNLLTTQNAFQMEGNSIIYLLLKRMVLGLWLPSPAGAEGIFMPGFLTSFFFTSTPYPAGGLDVILHPVAWAGWAGLLVTSLNLIPAGQLDGGHIFYALFGKKNIRRIMPVVLGLLVLLGFGWFTWWIWALLLFFMGQTHAEPLDRVTELDSKRRWLGYAMLFVFIFTFIPVPITVFGL